jgi:hypothetical protein
MSYTIRHFDKSNTTPALIINDKKVDNTTTTLSFYGLNSVDFGLGLNENYLHLMEHFCNNDIAVAKLVPGQLWFDKSILRMKIWTGNKWHILKEYTTNKLPKGFVTIVGNIVNGSTVSTANTLADEDGLGDFSYQWYLDAKKIANATEPTYTIVLSDVGHTLAVSLSYKDGSNNKEIVYSKEYPINSAANHLPTGSLTIDGTIAIGEIVTAIVNDIQDADGLLGGGGNFGWVLNGVDIPGENNPTYTIKPDDAGKTLKAKYYFVDLNNNSETVYSNPVVVPYAVTTTTAGPTTTTTNPPTPVIPDTSALQAKITLCNATVPSLKDLWFQAATNRVITEQKLANAEKSNSDLSIRIALETSDTNAKSAMNTKYTNWLNGINACIQNKQELFNTVPDSSSALSLTQAYQSKMEICKLAIDDAIKLYNTTITDYSGQIGVADTHYMRIQLNGFMSDAENYVSLYNTEWNNTFSAAVTANFNILEVLKTSTSVATITALSQYNTTTLKDIYDKLKVMSDAADAKTASITDIADYLKWKDLSDHLDGKTAAAQTKWTTSITEGIARNTAAQDSLASG